MNGNNLSGEISQFYGGKCVFITGATGFMGKVLVHKLLSSCPGLDKLYVLIRPKRDVLPQLRLEKIFDGPLFKQLKEVNPSCFKKVIAINGDITLPKLGISQEDLTTIIEKVSVIFHAAATIRFDEELRKYDFAYLDILNNACTCITNSVVDLSFLAYVCQSSLFP